MTIRKLKWAIYVMAFMVIIAGCVLGGMTTYASSEGGIIVDKIYQPETTYVYTYNNPTTHKDRTTTLHRDAKYTFVVAEGDECFDMNVTDEVYHENNVGDAYYRSEE